METSLGPQPRSSIGLAIACFAVGACVSWVNRYHDPQGPIYSVRYLDLVRFFHGEIETPLITYPLWGYPLVLSVLPAFEITSIVLQIALATGVLVVLYRSAAPHLRVQTPLVVLCVAAIPWFGLASVKLADIWAASFGVLALCAFARAQPSADVRSGDVRWTLTSGLLFGASFNFRSDFLPILAALPLLVLLLAPGALAKTWKPWALVTVLALLLIVPWGLFRVHHDRPFGITSTNAGMALYNSLGFAGNRWEIESNDDARTRDAAEAFGEGADPASSAANALFRARFLTAVRTHPLEFVRKIAHNFRATLTYGFYVIEIEPYLKDGDALAFEVLKEQLKSLAGAKVNDSDVERFKAAGLWDEDFSLTSVPLRQWQMAAIPVLTAALSSAFLLCILAAIVRILLFERARLQQPIFLFCVVGVVASWSLLCLLQFETRQANVLYPLGIPLVAVLCDWVAMRVRP